MFTDRLTFGEMVSLVVAAPPTSSLRYFLDAGWSREAHLLANMAEQRAGLTDISEPYERPGLDQRGSAPDKIMQADSYTFEELDRLDELRAQIGASGVSTTKVW